MKPVIRLLVPLAMLALSACGGGSSSPSSPSASSYTIGGTLSGLTTSSGLVLQVNGGDNLTVSSNGTFTFTNSLSSGTAYTVAVATQPSAETCAVSNGTSTATADVTNISVTCVNLLPTGSNVAAISVGTFPPDVSADDFNVPTAMVTVCDASSHCSNFQVLVDTGSSGLRLMGSSVTTAAAASGLMLPHETDGSGNNIYECAYYADGYAWGEVDTATVKIADETASGIPVQVITAGSPLVPNACGNSSPGGNTDLNTPDDFSADGVLGIGIGAQDCGSACVSQALYYYACPAGGCTRTSPQTTLAATSEEVVNPVAAFTGDNNGVVVQLPAISSAGAATSAAPVNGYLAFGVATRADNALGNAVVLPISASDMNDQQPMYVATSFNGTSESGIIDSGSNAFFFADSSLSSSLCTLSNAFYCPSTTQSLTVTNSGGGATSEVSFQIASLDSLHNANPSFYAFNNVGGPLAVLNGVSYFDFGLPFFFGRTVFTIIEGSSVGGTSYAQGAFAY